MVAWYIFFNFYFEWRQNDHKSQNHIIRSDIFEKKKKNSIKSTSNLKVNIIEYANGLVFGFYKSLSNARYSRPFN